MENSNVTPLVPIDKSAEEIAKKAIKVASEICVFTNDNIKVLKI
jgi:ATP-dependent HslUV protease subunit HslV